MPSPVLSHRVKEKAANCMLCGSPAQLFWHSTYSNNAHTFCGVLPTKLTEMMFPELSNWIPVWPVANAIPCRLCGVTFAGNSKKRVGPKITSVFDVKLIFPGPLMLRLMLLPLLVFVNVTKTAP